MTNADRHPDQLPADDCDRLRSRSRLFALGGLTLVGVLLCVYVAYPFLPALAWAMALAIMAFPLHERLLKVIPSPNWAAGITTAVVVAILVGPVLLVGRQLAQEAAAAWAKADEAAREGKVEATAAKVPYGPEAVAWFKQNVDVQAEAQGLARRFAGSAGAIAEGSGWFAVQFLVCVFVLFFGLRDWRHMLGSLRGLAPLARDESDYLFRRVGDSVYATVYATVLSSVVQGVTGGLVFWALGLPAPLLWGVIMVVLGIIPILGAGFVWVPAAVYLVAADRFGAAALLVGWGLLMVPVGEYVYARLAGDRLRLHPVPVLVAFVGGLAVFGASGMVIGPVVLAVTLGLIDVWRRRLNPDDPPAHPAASADYADPGRVPLGGDRAERRAAIGRTA